MNGNNKKHTPLDADELFRLLEAKGQDPLADSDMDDFEKEALEGFSEHSSADRARELTAEIHQLVDEKVQEKAKPAKRVIWFSAAASVILIVMLSVYFLTGSAKEHISEIALKTDAPVAKPTVVEEAEPPLQLSAPVETSAARAEGKASTGYDNNTKQTKNEDVVDDGLHTVQTKGSSGSGVSAGLTEIPGEVAQQPVLEKNFEATKDKYKEEKNLNMVISDDAKPSGAVYSAAPAFKADQSSGDITIAANKSAPDKKESLAKSTEAEKVMKEQNYNGVPGEAVFSSTRKKESKSKAPKSQQESEEDKTALREGSVSQTRSMDADFSVQKGYYTGGEKAIKNYIITWLKEQHYSEEQLKGTYMIHLKILANGKAETKSITPSTDGYINMTETLKKALDSMQNWNPAQTGGHASDSEITFDLTF